MSYRISEVDICPVRNQQRRTVQVAARRCCNQRRVPFLRHDDTAVLMFTDDIDQTQSASHLQGIHLKCSFDFVRHHSKALAAGQPMTVREIRAAAGWCLWRCHHGASVSGPIAAVATS